ncbi:unnamed protein product [Zymoseptoria tritici ST99CH_3D7]|uniref:U6 small nuclear RNA (adenine-(43)-N(6))-methyltransferase n=1 Tax=Zymoseptoria tritici (strain ST99CH_3D7) TaxID=1276538 RepID=A0A1X7S546_ZYMT9|nr:unnamed protein product [Zymoseptoria tritici ST99CH_3D7]
MKEIPYYYQDVDFDQLAKSSPDFAAIIAPAKRKGFIDFKNPKVVQQLSISLLQQDFSLQLTLPQNRLCPPIPVRWNYVRWIQDLLDTSSPTYRDTPDPAREVTGLDIGVGASCIYALLACSTREKWRMLGTDVDAHSLACATRNVKDNGLEKRIKLKQMSAEDPLLPLDMLKIEELDFVMTNPPFYDSHADFLAATKRSVDDESGPTPVLTGADNEMIYPGGDVAFVLRILQDSLKLRERVQWYTAMLSKLSSLQQVLAKLKEEGITNFAVTSLQPGRGTKRWGLAWSFGDMRVRNDVGRHGELVVSVLPQPTVQTVEGRGKMSREEVGRKVDELVKGLEVRWMWKETRGEGVMVAKENVWSRAARRKKKFEEEGREKVGGKAGEISKAKDAEMKEGSESESEDEEPVALAVKITCLEGKLEVRWLQGQDHVVFTSFCGVLKRALSTATNDDKV